MLISSEYLLFTKIKHCNSSIYQGKNCIHNNFSAFSQKVLLFEDFFIKHEAQPTI